MTFDEDTTQRTVSLIIYEDTLPERDEYIVVSLSNPTGGAVLASDGGSEATVVIEANDNAAGIVRLVDSARSVIVDEGDTVSLGLERSLGNLGVVEVTWEISGPGNVSLEFVPPSGTATFQEVCHFLSPLPPSLHFSFSRSPSHCSYGPLILTTKCLSVVHRKNNLSLLYIIGRFFLM